MRIEVLGSYGGQRRGARTTCLLINDTIALDAGSLAQALPIERQMKVRSIVFTHSHMDHTTSLPFFIENVFGREGVTDIYASRTTIFAIRKYLFNDAVWPDFTQLPNHLLPSMAFHEIEDEVPFTIDGVRFTPIPVDHLVETHGFLIEQDGARFLWSSDTGPTVRFWEVANRLTRLDVLAIEVSFDNSLQRIADLSYHLTPQTLAEELKKLDRRVPILLHHLKPACIERLKPEIAALRRSELHYLEQGKIYRL